LNTVRKRGVRGLDNTRKIQSLRGNRKKDMLKEGRKHVKKEKKKKGKEYTTTEGPKKKSRRKGGGRKKIRTGLLQGKILMFLRRPKIAQNSGFGGEEGREEQKRVVETKLRKAMGQTRKKKKMGVRE